MERNLRLVKILLEDVETNTLITRFGTSMSTNIGDAWARYQRVYGERIPIEEVEHHARICIEAGFIRDPNTIGLDDHEKSELQNIVGLTWSGYDKLDELRRHFDG